MRPDERDTGYLAFLGGTPSLGGPCYNPIDESESTHPAA